MVSVSVRLYEELNEFLPADCRKRTFTVRCHPGTTVKALVENLGVPHTEVDLILVNGESVGFDRVLAEADAVSVYPAFESWDISLVSKVRPSPLRDTRFSLDVHLGKLARLLRMMGFDAAYDRTTEDEELVRGARADGRIILSRDRGLLKRRAVTHGYLVRSAEPRRQLVEVMRRFDLSGQVRIFSRCTLCNEPLVRVSLDSVIEKVPPLVARLYGEFSRCPSCSRVFWRGTHWERMKALAGEVLAEAARLSDGPGPAGRDTV